MFIALSYKIKILFLSPIELTVQFSKRTYTSSERSGIIPVTLLLKGGISSNKITVIVMLSDQSPLSAEGKKCLSYFD